MLFLTFATAGAAGLAAHNQQAPAQVEVPAPTILPAPAPPPPPTPYRPKMAQPKGNWTGWVKNSDYPKQLTNGESGVTGFRLLIDRKGRPVKCIVTLSSGTPLLDELTCALLMKRANFSPALDGYRKPVEGTYSTRVRWVAPSQSAPAPAA